MPLLGRKIDHTVFLSWRFSDEFPLNAEACANPAGRDVKCLIAGEDSAVRHNGERTPRAPIFLRGVSRSRAAGSNDGENTRHR